MRSVFMAMLVVTSSVGAATGGQPDGLLGAGEALKRLQAPAVAAVPGTDDVERLLADLQRLDADPGSRDAAAVAWVSLFERWLKLAAKVDTNNPDHFDKVVQRPLSVHSLLARLPPPETWPKLEQRLRKVKAAGAAGAGLDLLGAVLAGGSVPKAMERARTRLTQLPSQERRARELKLKEIEVLVASSNDTSLVKVFERDLDLRAAAATRSRLEVPDLVTLVGPERASALLGRALTLPATSISVPVGDDTRTLAQDLLLQRIGQLRVPHWGLVRLPKAKAVYEALTTQFPEASKNTQSPEEALAGMRDEGDIDMDYGGLYRGAEERTEAQLHYLVALIAANESAKAEQLAAKLSEGNQLARAGSAMRDLRQAGYSAQMYGFFKTVLERNPTLGAWPTFFELAAENGKTEEAIAVVDKALSNPALPAGARRELQRQRVNALVAADHVDSAAAEIDRLLKASENQGDTIVEFRAGLALTLLEVGRLLDRPKDLERGWAVLKAALALPWPQQNRGQHEIRMKTVAALRHANRLADAEGLLLAALAESQQASEAQMMSAFAMASPELQSQLVELVGIYAQAERWPDVLRLVDGMPLWGVGDVAPIADRADSRKTPLAYMVARALVAQRDNRARPLLEAVISTNGGFDPAYQAYVEVLGEGAIAFLEDVQRRDRFEERPLIWKAVALVRAGKAGEAEAAARQAISIDPSDGEQGAGHRMRAYAILADALEQRGGLESAQSYRGAIDAIRIAERADTLRIGGLHRRAITLYQEALTKFSDAYCIQSRLAVELAHAGRSQEAEQHYRRAYELMPDSFGRVESHCFGCEKVFETATAQGVAEKVFQGFLRTTPQKPQVHYLMGYLRYEQGRYAEAVQFFRAAVAIDPNYLSAWKKLAESGRRIHLDRKERDLIALKILALDPQQRHSSPDLMRVADLSALWSAVHAARALTPQGPSALYPLPAAAARRDEALARLPEPMRRTAALYDNFTGAAGRRTEAPSVVVANTAIIRQIGQLIDGRDYYAFD